MVTTLSAATPAAYPSTKQNRQLDDKPSIFPLRSPDLSDTATTVSDSRTSSEIEDFHLDAHGSKLAQAQYSNKQSRPSLNLVTEFPASQVEALSPNVKVEQVGARRTAAKNRPKSIVSSKAEHINESGFVHRSKEVARIRNLVAKRANKVNKSNNAEKRRGNDTSPAKQIVIGISIPKSEAEVHTRKFGHQSAISLITPSTPQIVVTPAGEAPWRVPALPENTRTVAPQANKQAPKTTTTLARTDSFDSINYESPENALPLTDDGAPRMSSESQRPILSERMMDDSRPKSQGWWTLPLSPLISRAGTIKSFRKKASPDDAHIPPLPSRLSKASPPENELSPETPRRLGLASPRASSWSRWTLWEKTKAGGQDADISREMPVDDVNHEINVNATATSRSGLADEYYHACAIEMGSGEPYFDCVNHSCALGLPKLQSLFDEKEEDRQVGSNMATPGDAVAFIAITATPLATQQPEYGHQRVMSDSTGILSEPADALSPEVHEASLGTVGKARAVESPPLRPAFGERQEDEATLRALEGTDDIHSEATLRPVPPIPRAQSPRYPNMDASEPPPPAAAHMGPELPSPGPVSPDAQRTIAPAGAVPMENMLQEPQQVHAYKHYNYPQRNYQPPPASDVYNQERQKSDQKNFFKYDDDDDDDDDQDQDQDEERHHQAKTKEEKKEEREREKEKKEKKEKEGPGILTKLKQCASARKIMPRDDANPKKKYLIWAIFILLLLMVIGIVLLATLLTRHGDATPVQSQWLNLTGYPPMPTGISTIIRPDNTKTQAGCVVENMWSCALPKENQDQVAPNAPNQPNFRFEITFVNGTVPANMTIPLSKRTDSTLTPNPSPPSRADQLFIGNTTDNITEPFNGEATPFFMSFISAFPINPNDANSTSNITSSTDFALSRFGRRQSSSSTSNVTDTIPAPDVLPDGSAAPANLLPTDPYPAYQPVQLYNRGLPDEHYGFYIYYDKSIFLSINAAEPNSNSSSGNSTDDTNGGSTRSEARARCTFAQTRFLVQIFTNTAFGGHLLGKINTTVNSALDYTPPGSFPYPTTITIDRHGGDVNQKAAFCYGVDDLQVIQDDVKAVVAEFRAVGGPGLINPAPSLFEVNGTDSTFDQDAGGIDGGVGGCECQWQNWD